MTRQGHYLIGISGALVCFSSGYFLEGIGFFIGSNAPDTLECSYKKAGERGDKVWHYGRLIAHRTLTHYWPLWLVLLYLCQAVLPQYSYLLVLSMGTIDVIEFAQPVLMGYLFGGLGHLVFDALTPMGIPLLMPYGKRYSLRLYRSRFAEGLIGIVVLSFSFIFAVSRYL